MTSPFLAGVREVLAQAAVVYTGTDQDEVLRRALARLDEPLRVAIAGKVKAGKSTLLNALVGEELAPTDEGECTRIVTWYRDGLTYRVTLHPVEGPPRQVPFVRDGGAIDVNLGGLEHGEVDRLEVEWPSSRLAHMTLIDTPGMGSLSTDISERAEHFLVPETEESEADAVLYLMRHLHRTDLDFLETFRDERSGTPVNSVAVLSRADEVGVGRIDSLESAAKIAERCRNDPRIRAVAQTVVPVAGLLAQSGATLREDEFRALATIAAAPADDVNRLLLSADRFVNSTAPFLLTDIERQDLLDRFGVFGIRLSTMLLREGTATTSSALSAELIARSGLTELRRVLLHQFADRSDLLKARSALGTLEVVLEQHPTATSSSLSSRIEQITANAHEFAELRLLNDIRVGVVTGKPDEIAAMERLLGVKGPTTTDRLGIEPTDDVARLHMALVSELQRWQRKAENPLSTPDLVTAARTLVRTCEGLLAGLAVPG